MLRLLLREALLTAALLLLASLLAFVALDALAVVDWWGTEQAGQRAGLSRDEALLRGLPRVWLRVVPDAERRTRDDLEALRDPAQRAEAQRRLRERGTAALPTLLAQVGALRGEPQAAALEVLAQMAPALNPGDPPPAERAAALAYWDRFDSLRGLDFRGSYAGRMVRRLLERGSDNGAEQVRRLGSYAVPALCEALRSAENHEAVGRLAGALAALDARGPRLGPDAAAPQVRATREAWSAWCAARALGYSRSGPLRGAANHALEARYGRWLTALARGALGPSARTQRPVLRELRERLPASVLCGGLGGLLATALTVAFGGGAALRKRPLGPKLLELFGALVPGLGAFALGYALLLQLLAPGRASSAQLTRGVLAPQAPSLAAATLLLAGVGALWLRLPRARLTLAAVRREAESWARESRRPAPAQLLRHGLRVGVASLLVPLGLAGLALPATSVLVEPLTGVRGMGALTLAAVPAGDAPWALVTVLTTVPLALAGRWSRLALLWALRPASSAGRVSKASGAAGVKPATSASSAGAAKPDEPAAAHDPHVAGDAEPSRGAHD